MGATRVSLGEYNGLSVGLVKDIAEMEEGVFM